MVYFFDKFYVVVLYEVEGEVVLNVYGELCY